MNIEIIHSTTKISINNIRTCSEKENHMIFFFDFKWIAVLFVSINLQDRVHDSSHTRFRFVFFVVVFIATGGFALKTAVQHLIFPIFMQLLILIMHCNKCDCWISETISMCNEHTCSNIQLICGFFLFFFFNEKWPHHRWSMIHCHFKFYYICHEMKSSTHQKCICPFWNEFSLVSILFIWKLTF